MLVTETKKSTFSEMFHFLALLERWSCPPYEKTIPSVTPTQFECETPDLQLTFYNSMPTLYSNYININDNINDISNGFFSAWLQPPPSTDLVHRSLSLWWIRTFMVTTSQWSVWWIPMAMAAASRWKWPMCTSLLPGCETQFRVGLIHVWPLQG